MAAEPWLTLYDLVFVDSYSAVCLVDYTTMLVPIVVSLRALVGLSWTSLLISLWPQLKGFSGDQLPFSVLLQGTQTSPKAP